jgi:hypothetical protein
MNNPPTDIGHGLLRRLLRRGDETDLTEHLAELLRVPGLARAFFRLVEVNNPEDAEVEVGTQVIDPESRARPDLVLSTSSTTVWIEAKLDAGLTANQPLGYLNGLARVASPEKHLVFIIKSGRWAELSVEIRRAVGIAEDYARRFLHQDIPVTVVTWREVRDCFAAVTVGDPVAAYLLSEFNDHIDHHIERKVIPLTSELLPMLNDPKFLSAMAGLEDLVTDLMERLEADGHDVRHQDSGDMRQQGFLVAPKGDDQRRMDMWVGIVARAGVAFGKGPLWAWLLGDGWDEAAEARLKSVGFDLLVNEKNLPDWADCCLVPLRVSGATTGEQVHGLKQQVERMWGCMVG